MFVEYLKEYQAKKYMFIMYKNNICQVLKIVKFLIFADDANIFLSRSGIATGSRGDYTENEYNKEVVRYK